MLDQLRQDLERLVGKLGNGPVFTKFSGPEVQLEGPELYRTDRKWQDALARTYKKILASSGRGYEQEKSSIGASSLGHATAFACGHWPNVTSSVPQFTFRFHPVSIAIFEQTTHGGAAPAVMRFERTPDGCDRCS